MIALISPCVWPGWLKWSPVASFLFVCKKKTCCEILSWRLRSLSPIHLDLHLSFVHFIMYTIFLVWQFPGKFIFQVYFDVLMFLLSSMKGQITHDLPHFFIPFNCLLGCRPNGDGNLALIKWSLTFFSCLLKAVKGGSLNTSASLGSKHMDLQCLSWMDRILGSLGTPGYRKYRFPFVFEICSFFLMASSLGTALALPYFLCTLFAIRILWALQIVFSCLLLQSKFLQFLKQEKMV